MIIPLYINVYKYSIDDLGNVYSNYTGVWRKMSPITNPSGYLTLGLTDVNGVRKTYFIHRLVYTAFNNLEYRGDYDVHHKDYNKDNCSLKNLSKMSHKDNVEDYLETHEVRKKLVPCKMCGVPIVPNKTSMCIACLRMSKSNEADTSISELIDSIVVSGGNFTKAAKMFGITDNALRKRFRKKGLPDKSSYWRN